MGNISLMMVLNFSMIIMLPIGVFSMLLYFHILVKWEEAKEENLK